MTPTARVRRSLSGSPSSRAWIGRPSTEWPRRTRRLTDGSRVALALELDLELDAGGARSNGSMASQPTMDATAITAAANERWRCQDLTSGVGGRSPSARERWLGPDLKRR